MTTRIMNSYTTTKILFTISKTARRAALGATVLAAALCFAPTKLRAADAPLTAPPPSRINELVNLDFLSEYVTPRGMIVDENGLTFQPLLLTLVNVYKGDTFVSDFSLHGGAWADIDSAGVSVHAPYGTRPKTDFVEVDPIFGFSVDFAKHFTLDLTYTAFAMQVLDIGTSQHLNSRLGFDDSPYLGAFALHPYVLFWQELAKKSTDADVPEAVFGPSPHSGKHAQPGSSFYFDLGVDPSYTFKDALGGLKIEAPCRVMFPDDRFYGDYYASSSAVGLFELGLKATVPMKFMPDGYGHWNFHVGVNFLYFVDDNLVNLNEFNVPQKPVRDTLQGFAGVTCFF
jgi:hypothetical protein